MVKIYKGTLDEVIEMMKNNKMFVNHFHIPLQTGCDVILKRMNNKSNEASVTLVGDDSNMYVENKNSY